jgi:hypothetical protein
MIKKPEKSIISKSIVNYGYSTIKITQSRIDKGLIAIPISLARWFPDHNDTIQVYLSDSPVAETKDYSSYTSSTHECRIGGVSNWFKHNSIKNGEEVVIQIIDIERHIYRLIPERNFVEITQNLQQGFDVAKNEQDALSKANTLAKWNHVDKDEAFINEYYRLAYSFPSGRKYFQKNIGKIRESIPVNLKAILREIYTGHCQICDFTFLKKDNEPYFEVHHLEPSMGHHPKNVVVVCGNCHNQFEHANVKKEYSDDYWLVKVLFNNSLHLVNQVLYKKKINGFFKQLYM